MKALFILRAQPLHKGHLHAIKKAMEKFEVIIGIGSSNVKNTFENPFSFKERKEMFRLAGVNCKIVPILDFYNCKKWTSHILNKVDFDVVISGNEWIKECFKGKKKVLKPEFLEPRKYKATLIREKIVKGERWEHLVHEKVANYIKKIKGEERIRKLASKT
ncbi:MAG: adenylyltransferase/cytidyltransferase family protein [Candidatus Aenigmarchaeota archaeon]|nr:adenylyltransferase/cytidyltransferase family protein [Candidatus Aenigmarchaeota archaeon]